MPGSFDAKSEIKQRLDIVDVIGTYVRLKKAGREFKGLCPFHDEKSPSFTVSQERQMWYCFGCSEGGDMFTFVEKAERIDFREALSLLADKAGVTLPEYGGRQAGDRPDARQRMLDLHDAAASYFSHILWNMDAGVTARDELDRRGIPRDLAEAFRIGYAPAGGESGDALVRYLAKKVKATPAELVEAGLAVVVQGKGTRDKFRHRLQFPISDDRGRVIGFGGRAFGDGIPKYLNSPETAIYHKSLTLFGYHAAREHARKENAMVLVEGYFDVLAFHRAGIPNVVASSGTALTEQHVAILARIVEKVLLCFDGDSAGKEAAKRASALIARVPALQAKIIELPPEVKDPDELVNADPEKLVKAVAEARPNWEVLLEWAIGSDATRSVEDRRSAADRALPVLLLIEQATVRDLYAEWLAERLHLQTASLLRDLGAKERREFRPRRETVPSGLPLPPHVSKETEERISPVERHIGVLLVEYPTAASKVFSGLGLTAAELASPLVRTVFDRATRAQEDVIPLDHLTDEETAFIAKLSLEAAASPETQDESLIERIAADCVRALRTEQYGLQTKQIQREIQEAERRGDSLELQRLASSLQEIMHERQKSLRAQQPGRT